MIVRLLIHTDTFIMGESVEAGTLVEVDEATAHRLATRGTVVPIPETKPAEPETKPAPEPETKPAPEPKPEPETIEHGDPEPEHRDPGPKHKKGKT